MTEIIIRKAKEKDLLSVVRLLADDQLGSVREDASEPIAGFYLDAFKRMDEQKGNDLFVVERHNNVIGCMQLTLIAGVSRKGMTRCQIEGVRISADHRSSGLGQKMMDFALQYAKDNHCGLVQLTTDKSREDAHRFYENLGYKASHIGMKLDLLKL
ncbi:MAG: GNAT family N-acetyltransferase [Sneathiellales bacterium]|nr:GNAT family N-acetyltransferase [Sneathiellales bacterium]